jgi:hypothetical protein
VGPAKSVSGGGASARTPRTRACHADSCGRSYVPRRWNQRYCDEGCRPRAKRWQAAKRQQRRRDLSDEVRRRHREEEAARRRRRRQARDEAFDVASGPSSDGVGSEACEEEATANELPGEAPTDEVPVGEAPADEALAEAASIDTANDAFTQDDSTDNGPLEGLVPLRGHAGRRSRGPICDRPACYRPPLAWTLHRRCYCGPDCRRAVRQVEDRERKWLERGVRRGDESCARELDRRRRSAEHQREAVWRALRQGAS